MFRLPPEKCLLRMELCKTSVCQLVVRGREKPPYSVEDFLGTLCGRIRTLIRKPQPCAVPQGMMPTHWDSAPGVTFEFKAGSSQVPAILHFPSSSPLLWFLRAAENLWFVCLKEKSRALENSALNYFCCVQVCERMLSPSRQPPW